MSAQDATGGPIRSIHEAARRMRFLWVLTVMVLGSFAMAEAVIVERTFKQAEAAITVARDWQAVAGEWQQQANRAIAIAQQSQAQIERINDDFLVCNSMLPKEQRMR